jgi:hypothetical protein
MVLASFPRISTTEIPFNRNSSGRFMVDLRAVGWIVIAVGNALDRKKY